MSDRLFRRLLSGVVTDWGDNIMSVETEADRVLDLARGHISDAIHSLDSILHSDDMWGADEFSNEYRSKIEKSVRKLSKVKTLLGPRVRY